MNHFYLRVVPADMARIVISVSKKISKKATMRNKIRRRVRPLMREFIPNLKPATYFIIAKPGAEKAKGEELKTELLRLIRSIRN